MILSKVKNGDLRDCELTLKDYEKIIDVFIVHLLKSNHERISYE
jgi:membrane-associated HD superfamily phosphohydrolase